MPLGAGWALPHLPHPCLPHLQCPSPTLGPLPLTGSPSLPVATPNLHLAADSPQGFGTVPGTTMPPSPLGPPPGVGLAVSWPWTSDQSSEPPKPRPLTFLSVQLGLELCSTILSGELGCSRETSTYPVCTKPSSSTFHQNETRIPHELLISQTLIFTLGHQWGTHNANHTAVGGCTSVV